MKRFFLLAMILVVGAIGVKSIELVRVRPQGTSQPSNDAYYLVCDSSDTFEVDTFYSDTVTIGDMKFLNWKFSCYGFTMADSANDSVLMIVQGIGTIDGRYPITVFTDTIGAAGTIDSAAIYSGIAKIDSLPVNQLYFRTVVSDSFILGAGVDSSLFRLKYHVVPVIEINR